LAAPAWSSWIAIRIAACRRLPLGHCQKRTCQTACEIITSSVKPDKRVVSLPLPSLS
jgi:hypothetical protein